MVNFQFLFESERQAIILNEKSGSWHRINNEGESEVVNLDGSNIVISDDVLTIVYIDKEREIKFKFILSGWKVNNNKRMFGTVYLYKNRNNIFQLFNAFPVSYEDGMDKIPNQVFWNYFRGPKIEKVDAKFIGKLEKDLNEVSDIKISKDELWSSYSLSSLSKLIYISRPGNPIHPAAIGYFGVDHKTKRIQLISKYTGQESEFKKYENKFKNDMRLEIENTL